MMFRFVCRGWNCSEYIDDCLYSLQAQTVKDWTATLILDPGEDDSIIKAQAWAERDKRITVYVNSRRMGVCHNMWHGIQFAGKDPDDILCIVDLDDTIPYYCLEEVLRVYEKNKNLMCTYGSFILESRGCKSTICKPYSNRERRVRMEPWRATHLKTLKFGVMKHVPQDYFMHKGAWGEAASDLALMFSVIEVVGFGKSQHIKKPIYNYRNHTKFSLDRGTQKKWERVWRNKKPLQRQF